MSPDKPRRIDLPNLGIGLAIGSAVTIAILLTSAASLENSATTLIKTLLVAVSVCLVLLAVLYALRNIILAKIFGGATGSFDSAIEAANTIATNFTTDPLTAADAAKRLLKESTAWASWYLGIRTLVTATLWLVGALVAALTTIVLLTQTRVLQEQTTKIEAQTRLFERQNQIMAGEGQWELFWKAHYEITPEYQIDAVIRVETPNGKVSGANIQRGRSLAALWRDQRYIAFQENKDQFPMAVSLTYSPAPTPLPTIDARALSKLTTSTISGWKADYITGSISSVEEMRFLEAQVSLERCTNCDFSFSEITNPYQDLTLSRCTGESSIFSATNITLGNCNLKSAAFKPDKHLALQGDFGDVVVYCGTCCRMGVAASSRIGTLVLVRDATDKRDVSEIIPGWLVSGSIREIFVATGKEGAGPYTIDQKQTERVRVTVLDRTTQ